MSDKIRLGVNVDHVATIRNARGGVHPDPVQAAKLALRAGADGITAHLREDRRHIVDDDIRRLAREIDGPLNMEMAATAEMVDIALQVNPHAACLVPENREERTTEGGLDAAGDSGGGIESAVRRLSGSGIRVSLFIEPSGEQIDAAVRLGAPVVELHTGAYCESTGEAREKQRARIVDAAAHAAKVGIECHAGHGLNYDTVQSIARIASIKELNIGHFLVGESVFRGFEGSIRHMRDLIDQARV